MQITEYTYANKEKYENSRGWRLSPWQRDEVNRRERDGCSGVTFCSYFRAGLVFPVISTPLTVGIAPQVVASVELLYFNLFR